MKFRWWTKLALGSAIAGFVVSGPPSNFERSSIDLPAAPFNNLTMPLPVAETFEATETFETTETSETTKTFDTTELVAAEIVDEQVQVPELSSPQTDETTTAP